VNRPGSWIALPIIFAGLVDPEARCSATCSTSTLARGSVVAGLIHARWAH
jgi:hypothetical protein